MIGENVVFFFLFLSCLRLGFFFLFWISLERFVFGRG